MKLWQKTSFVCIAVLAVIITILTWLIIMNTRDQILDLTIEQTESQNMDLYTSTEQMVKYYLEETDSALIEESAVKYCFTQFAEEGSVLVKGEELIYSDVIINPVDYRHTFGKEDTYSLFQEEIDGREILMIERVVIFGNSEYTIYTVKDISELYISINETIFIIIILSIFSLLLGIGLIVMLMKRLIRPINLLAKTSSEIANGQYSIRADIHTGDELEWLAKDFNKMADSVESHIEALVEKTERQQLFIGGVSHEFKTPLTVMLLHSKMLQEANMTEDEREKSLLYIQRQCEHLNKMVQNMLNLLAMDNEVEFADCDMNQMIEHIRTSTREVLKCRNIELVTECSIPNMRINPSLMEIAVINLVDNASKSYDDVSKRKQVYLCIHKNIIEVKDEGRGIETAHLEQIFEPFYMIDKSRSKKNGGTGLGLTLVKKIVELHSADIEIISTIGEGTTVRITL